MSLISRRHRPASLFDAFADFDSVFDQLLTQPKGSLVPAVDIREEGDAYLVHADIPGVKKDDIHVSLHDGVLSIDATTASEEEKEDKGHKYIRRERRSGTYSRKLMLADDIDESAIAAKFADGVLELRIPRRKPAAGEPRKISVA